MASSPRIVKGPIDKHPPDTEAMQKPRLAVHHRSACSGLKALRNTSAARRQTAKLCYRFGPLTPSARSANLIAGDGTKNGFPAPNKEPAKNPYRFESCFLQQRVRLSRDFIFVGTNPGFPRGTSPRSDRVVARDRGRCRLPMP